MPAPWSDSPSRYTRRRFMQAGAATAGLCWLSPWHAAWAASTGPAGGLRLLFYTDIHTRVEWETPLALEQAGAAMNAQQADLIIAGGDLITDGFQSTADTVAPRWDAYLAMHRALRPDPHPVLGNHDLVAADPDDGSPRSKQPRAPFLTHFDLDRAYRSFDIAGYHVILLDVVQVTGDALRYRGFVDAAQRDWLMADLATVSTDTPIVLVTHMPLLTAYFQATKQATHAAPANRVVVNSNDVLDLFAKHNLVLVLQGHLHVNELIRWRDTTFITGGAVCGRWWRGAWHGTREGFGMVTLQNNQVDWEYMDYGWSARRPADQ